MEETTATDCRGTNISTQSSSIYFQVNKLQNSSVDRPKKKVRDSSLVTSYLMMPQDANPHGNVYGGTIMRDVDGVAAAVAERHCRTNTVTASIDRMDFIKPVYVGNLLTIKASINCVGETSMEIGVRIEAENLATGQVVHTGSCYLTYVALDRDGKPTVVPDVELETEDERRRYSEAQERRKIRLMERTQSIINSKHLREISQ